MYLLLHSFLFDYFDFDDYVCKCIKIYGILLTLLKITWENLFFRIDIQIKWDLFTLTIPKNVFKSKWQWRGYA